MSAPGFAAMLWAWTLGALIVAACWPRERALRADAALLVPLAALVGLAATSLTFFAASLVVARPAWPALGAEVLLAAWLGRRLRRRPACAPGVVAPGAWSWPALVAGLAFALAALAAAVVAARAYEAEPYGGWDGWAIWNLHARVMLRAGPAWPHVLRAPELSWTHPDYPWLVPASVARLWAWTGGEPPLAPALVSAGFAMATVALLAGAIARMRGKIAGCVAGLVLVTTPFFVTFATNEHADIPLGAFMLAAMVLLAQEEPACPALAALCAAGAAWTKNEGLLFVLVFAIGAAVFARRHLATFFLTLALGLLPLLVFKFSLAPPNDLMGAPLAGRLAQLADGSRHALILASLWRDVAAFGEWRFAPYLALALPFAAWRARRRLGPCERLLPFVLGLMLAGYYAVYLLTPLDLAWHLDSSLVRLLLQLWPIALLVWALAIPSLEIAARPLARGPALVIFLAATPTLAAVLLTPLSRQTAANELAYRDGIAAVPATGWFGVERSGETTWSWSGGNATLVLHAGPRSARDPITLRFSLRSLAPREVTIRSGGRVLWQGKVSERDFVPVELAGLAIAPGTTALEFVTDAPAVPESASPAARALAFALYDFRLR